MPPLAYFGIESNAFNLVVDLLIVFLVVLYFALLYWTYADARRRIEDPLLVGCAFVVALFPFVGPIIYMVVRPPEYLEDVRERELETQAAEARLHRLDYGLCPHCDYPIERDFVRCPSCLRKLKERCVSCSKPLDRAWTICPYCETEVPDVAPRRRTRRRAAASADEPPTAAERSAARTSETVVRGGESTAGSGESTARPVRGALTERDSELARESVVLSEPPAPDEPPVRPRESGRASRPPGGRPRPSS
jgi:hypothetical protein